MIQLRFVYPILIFLVSYFSISCSQLLSLAEPLSEDLLIMIPGNRFEMGDSWDYADHDALPVHLVEIDTFYVTKYEITIAQYLRYVKQNHLTLPPDFPKDKPDNYPAVGMNWQEASDFCECYGMRLPTEAEWEYMATGGREHQLYAGTNDLAQVHLYSVTLFNSNDSPSPVGSKRPNLFGLYDLTGNVDEWIGDYYPDYATRKPAHFPENPLRIIRGGSFMRSPQKNFTRVGLFADQRSWHVGFRCVKTKVRSR